MTNESRTAPPRSTSSAGIRSPYVSPLGFTAEQLLALERFMPQLIVDARSWSEQMFPSVRYGIEQACLISIVSLSHLNDQTAMLLRIKQFTWLLALSDFFDNAGSLTEREVSEVVYDCLSAAKETGTVKPYTQLGKVLYSLVEEFRSYPRFVAMAFHWRRSLLSLLNACREDRWLSLQTLDRSGQSLLDLETYLSLFSSRMGFEYLLITNLFFEEHIDDLAIDEFLTMLNRCERALLLANDLAQERREPSENISSILIVSDGLKNGAGTIEGHVPTVSGVIRAVLKKELLDARLHVVKASRGSNLIPFSVYQCARLVSEWYEPVDMQEGSPILSEWRWLAGLINGEQRLEDDQKWEFVPSVDPVWEEVEDIVKASIDISRQDDHNPSYITDNMEQEGNNGVNNAKSTEFEAVRGELEELREMMVRVQESMADLVTAVSRLQRAGVPAEAGAELLVPPGAREWLSVKEAAVEKRLSYSRMRSAIGEGLIPGAKKFGNKWFLPKEGLAAWRPPGRGRPAVNRFQE